MAKIIHITQHHGTGPNPSGKELNTAASSQIEVGNLLIKYKDFPILEEGLTEDLTDESSYWLSKSVKTIFPKGFPDRSDELTSDQKDLLYDLGAVKILYYLGIIKTIYKSIHPEQSKEIDENISNFNYSYIFEPREEEAITCATEVMKKKFKNMDDAIIIIVFGQAHSFKTYCDQFGYELEIIRTTVLECLKEDETEEPGPPLTLDELNNLLSEYPDNLSNRIERGRIYLNEQKYLEAMEDFKFVLNQYPDYTEARNGIELCQTKLNSNSNFSNSNQTTSIKIVSLFNFKQDMNKNDEVEHLLQTKEGFIKK